MKVAIELAARYGLDGIEIRSVWEKGPHELDKEDIGQIRKLVNAAKMEVCSISSPFFKCNMDKDEEVEQNMRILEKSIQLAQELGTGIVRGFTFWNTGDFNACLPKIISRFEEPVKMLEKAGITLALESDPSVFASNAGRLVKVIEGINQPCVKGLWDPGNDMYDPRGEIPYPDGYEIIKPYIVHVHLKDAVRLPDGKAAAAPIGEGQVDFVGQFGALLKDGYSGYVVLETHYRPQHEMSEELLALPKGSAFSHLGYEATEQSLKNWMTLLERLV